MPLFLLMFIVTAIEVVLIAKVGSAIGFFATFFLIIATAYIGSRMLSKQWRFVMGKLQSLQGNPSDALLEALVLVICGVLLVTPGFLTDIVGFLGLIPATRIGFIEIMRKNSSRFFKKGNFSMHTASSFGGAEQPFSQSQTQSQHQPEIIEGEIIEGEVIDGKVERKDD